MIGHLTPFVHNASQVSERKVDSSKDEAPTSEMIEIVTKVSALYDDSEQSSVYSSTLDIFSDYQNRSIREEMMDVLVDCELFVGRLAKDVINRYAELSGYSLVWNKKHIISLKEI